MTTTTHPISFWVDHCLQYEGIIFDCDGTLTDSMPVHFRAWCESMEKFGLKFDEKTFYGMAGMPTTTIIQILSQRQKVKVDVLEAANDKEAAFERRIKEVPARLDVCEVARHLSKQRPVVVASGGMRESVIDQLKQIGVMDFMQAVVGAEDTEKHKPEPDVFLEAAKRIDIDPTKCVVWEDSHLGFDAATAAGMDWIDVKSSPWRRSVDQQESA